MTEHGERDIYAWISFGKLLLQSGKSVTKSTKSLRTAEKPFVHMPQQTATRAWNFFMGKHATKRVVMPGLAHLQDRLCTYSAPRKQRPRLRNKHLTAFVELKLLADVKYLFSNATSLGNRQEHKERLFPCSHIENASVETGLHELQLSALYFFTYAVLVWFQIGLLSLHSWQDTNFSPLVEWLFLPSSLHWSLLSCSKSSAQCPFPFFSHMFLAANLLSSSEVYSWTAR